MKGFAVSLSLKVRVLELRYSLLCKTGPRLSSPNPTPLPSLCQHAGLVCICLNFGSNIMFLGFSKIITVFYGETQNTTNTRNIYVANVAGSSVLGTMRINELQSHVHSSHGFSCPSPPSRPPPPPKKKKQKNTHTHTS